PARCPRRPPPPRPAHCPHILPAATVGHEEQRLAIAAPHRPRILRATLRDLRVRWSPGRRVPHQPNLALVEMTVSCAPPLRAGVGARGDRDDVTGRRGRSKIL